jgi:hypothetical protein
METNKLIRLTLAIIVAFCLLHSIKRSKSDEQRIEDLEGRVSDMEERSEK